jgi:hypothetical protein
VGVGTSAAIPVDAVEAVLSGERVMPPVTWFERVVQLALVRYVESQRTPKKLPADGGSAVRVGARYESRGGEQESDFCRSRTVPRARGQCMDGRVRRSLRFAARRRLTSRFATHARQQ